MAVRGHRDGVGIPIVLMHEGEGMIVTIETKSGYAYRGYMESAEDNMNASLRDVTATGPRGKVTRMERVFVRGSQIVFIVFPDLLGEAPMFRRVALAAKGITVAGGLGRGRQAAIGARVAKLGGPPGPGGPPPPGGFPPPPWGGGPPPGFPMGMPPGGFGPPPPWAGGPPPGFPPPPFGMMPPDRRGGGYGGPPPPFDPRGGGGGGYRGPPPPGPPPPHAGGGGGGAGRGSDLTRPAWMMR